MSFDLAVETVLAQEGGYVDHPEDPGGATNFGITRATLEQWRAKPVAKAEVMVLTRDEARQIYCALYWTPCRCEQMPPAIGLIAFDGAVNLGVRRSTRLLQRALGVGVDGVLGPVTLDALRRAGTPALVDEYMARRAVHYASLRKTFHLGWYRRLMDIHRQALVLERTA